MDRRLLRRGGGTEGEDSEATVRKSRRRTKRPRRAKGETETAAIER